MALRNAAAAVELPREPETGDLFENDEVFQQEAPRDKPASKPAAPKPVAKQPVATSGNLEVVASQEINAPAIVPARPVGNVIPLKAASAAYMEFQNVIALDSVESMGVGAMPRVTVDLGGFQLDKEDLGPRIKLDLMSWNYRYMCVTGAPGEEARKMIRVSYDGVTCSGTGESVQDVMASFRDAGYDGAGIKCYIDLWGQLLYANGQDVPEDEQQVVQIQLSPESVKKFKAHQVSKGFQQARGTWAPSSLLTLDAKRGEYNGNRYGYCVFS